MILFVEAEVWNVQSAMTSALTEAEDDAARTAARAKKVFMSFSF
jgi:hypothetical protein